MCTKKIGENQIILKIEGEEVQKKINLLVIPYNVNFFSSSDTLIENNILPLGNADNPYIIKFKLVDINNKTIDCPDKFNYQFSNSNTTFTDYDCNSNQTIYINNSFTIMDEYSFKIPMINKTYSFNINHGEPIIDIKYINHTEIISIGQKASITLSLDVKDKYNNSVPKEEIINNLNISLGCGDINYTFFSLEIEENKNGLLKYSTKNDIQIEDSYIWRIYYNGKNISNDYITTVITLSDFSYFEIKFEYDTIKNGSIIDCNDYSTNHLYIYPKDQDGNIEQTSEIIEAYYFYDGNKVTLLYKKKSDYYQITIDCSIIPNDANIFVIFKKNDTTGIFLFDAKKD